ncbi:MAG: ComF family protein [Ignavibacteria bacterium]|nr:ComF family protein [Ignavibacteria bacterium]MBT8380899.1 ComF family protein [Ignavibacteria bacterium]MBT8391022.1 ComF family protein [Ignavibacteria bacterium]NNJ54170.1 ComF family protein [Ignavibacteriaceae bacterium]NNL20677.1 ComF family protein [Ignavibacteriaceae bacterium]
MKNTFYTILDFFLPRYCAGCSKKLSFGEPLICSTCFDDIPPADPDRIEIEFERKFERSNFVQDFLSAYVYESDGTLHNIIHSLKYNKKFRLGILLGNKLAETVKGINNKWRIDLILAIPLHHLKKAERGFNQSDFIVKGMANSLKIPYSNKVLKRIRFTESQTKLNLSERAQNVSGAFQVRQKKKINGRNILLVDDVITTGATINECAKVLIENGANKVYSSSIAIAE